MGFLENIFKTKPRILIADDDLCIRVMLSKVLAAQGYEVVAAVDGLEALGFYRGGKFDLVILDVNMPKMDGSQLLETIRTLPGGREQAVMMLTAEDQTGTINKAFELNAADYIFKHGSIKDLVLKINAHFPPKKDL